MATEYTEQTVLDFLKARGGTVRQQDLIDHFGSVDKNNDSNQMLSGERLLDLVDNDVDVKLIDGVKFVCLKGGCSAVPLMRSSPVDENKCNGNDVCEGVDAGELADEQTATKHTESCEESNTMQPQKHGNEPSDANGNSDIGHKKLDNDASDNGNDHLRIEEETVVSSPQKPVVDFPSGEVKLRDRRRRESAPALGLEPDSAHSGGGQVRGGRRVSKGCQRALLTSGLSEDSAWEGLETGFTDGSTPKGSRRNFIELMMSQSPQVRRSMIHRGSRLRDSVRSDGGDSASLFSSAADETLDPLEHEWMLCASEGLWDSLVPLLTLEPGLVAKRDFVTGFTCLHWAAKQGNGELLGRLMAFAKDNAVHVDVNARSGAGYTPLHLAAMHGHTEVVRLLMSDWEADTEARDYSGRKACQYLTSATSPDPHDGDLTSPGTDSDPENTEGTAGRWRLPRILPSNLNPLRLLNPLVEGQGERKSNGLYRKSSLSKINVRLHRGRHRTQIIHSTSFRDGAEVDREDIPPVSPVKARPLSNLFG